MASLIDLSGLTLNPQEALTVSEAVFEMVYSKPELNEAHAVATGIQMQTQIPFYGLMGLVGKKSLGSCNVNAETKDIDTTQKYWTPQLINFRLTHCQEDINQLFKMWKRSPDALKTWEDMEMGQEQFLTDRILDATLNSVLRISSFGDTAEDNVSGGGNITNGTSPLYFTMIDGFWPQIIVAAVAGTSPRYQITENGAATFVQQDDLAPDRALLAMRGMYNDIDSRAFDSGQLVFQVTRSLLKNWQDYMEDKSLAFMLNRAEEGKVSKWEYRGIPIVVRNDWDRIIRTYFSNGTKWYLPHRAILTPIENVPIGTSDESNFTSLDMFYDRTDKKHYSDVAYYIDAKLLEEYKLACAY